MINGLLLMSKSTSDVVVSYILLVNVQNEINEQIYMSQEGICKCSLEIEKRNVLIS